MADCDCCIAGVSFLHQQSGYRFTNDIASSQHHTSLAISLYLISLKKHHNSRGSRRPKTRQADRHSPDIDWMESINILTIVYCLNHFLLIDVAWQW